MARQIAETPTLLGKDAERFFEKLNKPIDPVTSAKERERIMKVYKELRSGESSELKDIKH